MRIETDGIFGLRWPIGKGGISLDECRYNVLMLLWCIRLIVFVFIDDETQYGDHAYGNGRIGTIGNEYMQNNSLGIKFSG